jgi:hypothetical protein
MITQEEIANRVFEELIKLQEEFGDEIALAFLSGIQFATSLQSEVFQRANSIEIENFSDIATYLGEFYSKTSKGEIS